jgi:raffinose/stachyose/melibiose transport system substrate-binding protein
VNKTFLSDDYASAQQALMDGTAGFYAMGNWIIPDLNKLAPDKIGDIGAIGIPFDEGQLITSSPPGGLFVPSNSKNKELAKKIVAFMASPEAQAAYYKAQPGIPFIKGLKVDGLLPPQNDFVKLMEEGKAFSSPLDFTKYQKGPFEKYLQDVLVEGGKSPIEAAEELDKDFAKAAKAKEDPNWK